MIRLKQVLVIFIAILFLLPSISRADKSNALLKGIGKKKKRTPSVSLLVRDDLRAAFKEVMTDYLAEDLESFLSHFTDTITDGRRALNGRKAAIGKKTLKRRIKREFRSQDFTKVEFDEVFDLRSPGRLFILSEAHMHDAIPVWGFGISPGDIAPLMKPDDYLVIANTAPDLEKVTLPLTMYLIFRREGKDFVAVGLF